ncbi:hypothetical protein DPV78_002432 [Talaromyces pinophilus]|nr:hypothetical protein DPV78_002432 [Talaromyces pinophilus]
MASKNEISHAEQAVELQLRVDGETKEGMSERLAWDNEWKRQHQVSEIGVSSAELEFNKEAVHTCKDGQKK